MPSRESRRLAARSRLIVPLAEFYKMQFKDKFYKPDFPFPLNFSNCPHLLPKKCPLRSSGQRHQQKAVLAHQQPFGQALPTALADNCPWAHSEPGHLALPNSSALPCIPAPNPSVADRDALCQRQKVVPAGISRRPLDVQPESLRVCRKHALLPISSTMGQ